MDLVLVGKLKKHRYIHVIDCECDPPSFSCSSKVPSTGAIETRSRLHSEGESTAATGCCTWESHHFNCTDKVPGWTTSGRSWVQFESIPWFYILLPILGFPGPGEYHQDDCQCDRRQYKSILLCACWEIQTSGDIPGNLVKNAVEEGKRIPRRMETSSDLGTCIKWVEDIGVPVIYAYSAYYSAKCRGIMKGEGQSMRVALEFLSKIFRLLSADECMLGWRVRESR